MWYHKCMSNDTQVLDRNPVSVPTSNNVVQPQVGSLNKEQAPPVAFEPDLSEFIKPEAEPNVDQEQKDMGVVATKEAPDLTQIVDMQHAGPSVPVPLSPTGLIQISEKEDISNSHTWLNTLKEKVRKVKELMGF